MKRRELGLSLLKENPYGVIEYWNPITEAYGYGRIKEVSSSIIDKKTNWELYQTSGFVDGEIVRITQTGDIRLTENGDYRIIQ